mmetsp:Transcript_1020/g.2616  ORF Transcript_1020/g.2616 Transcript_1020/m.2616 type:complete len:123 (+) Transcript_1020:51-419(+)
MKLNLFLVASTFACGHAFVVNIVTPQQARTGGPVTSSSSSLEMGGFLDGRGKKIEIREKEDAAMWVDENDTGGWNPFSKKNVEPKQSVAKKGKPAPVAAKKKKEEPKKAPPSTSGFKFPWDK